MVVKQKSKVMILIKITSYKESKVFVYYIIKPFTSIKKAKFWQILYNNHQCLWPSTRNTGWNEAVMKEDLLNSMSWLGFERDAHDVKGLLSHLLVNV